MSFKPSRWVQAIDASGIRRIFDLAAKLENPVDMSIGQPHFGTPEPIKKAAIKAISSGKNAYLPTQGLTQLIDVLKSQVRETKGRMPEDLFITSGVSGGLYLVFMTLFNPGDEIIIPEPYFVMYESLPKLAGAIPVPLDIYPDFIYKKEALEKVITPRTKAIVLNSPANPTGKVLSQREIDFIVDIAKKHDLFIISDEIYERFTYDLDGLLPSPFGTYEKSILLGGFSKTYSTTGWRVGYAAGPPEVLQEMKKLQQYTFVCAPAPFQYALLECFSLEVKALIQRQIDSYKQKRDFFYNALWRELSFQPSEGAFYAFIETPDGDGERFVERAIEKNCLLIAGSVFSKKKSHVRISFACEDEVLKEGVNIIKALL